MRDAPGRTRAPWCADAAVRRARRHASSCALGHAVRARSPTPSSRAPLGVAVGERAPLADVRAAVLALRARKGMVLDAGRPRHVERRARSSPTRCCRDADLPDGAPRYPCARRAERDGRASARSTALVKTSAAWLIEHAGFGKGFGLPGPGGALDQAHARR